MPSEAAMNEKVAAIYVGCTVALLRLYRSRKQGPRYYQVGKLVRYRREDLDGWIARHFVETEAPER